MKAVALVLACLLVPLARGAAPFDGALLSRARAEDSSEYARATERGLAEFGDRNFEEARAHFIKAHALAPSARTLRALGMVEFELKSYVDSVRYLEQALASHVRPLDEQRRKEAETLLETANTYVARYVLHVTPRDALLSLDGSQLDVPSGAPLVLDIGEHVLELRATGYASERRTLRVKGGELNELNVKLALLADTDKARDVQVGTKDKKPVYKSPWLWTAVGLVVAGAAAGTLVALYGRNDASTKMEEPVMGTGGADTLMPPF